MNDAEKLSRRSYEPFTAGVSVAGGNAPNADFQRRVDVEYEVVYFRKPRRSLRLTLASTLLDLYSSITAAGRSKFSAARRAPTGLGTAKVTMPSETFVIASNDDLKAHSQTHVFTSEAAAAVALKELVNEDATLNGKLQVVSSYEVAA